MAAALGGQRFRHMKPWERRQAEKFMDSGELEGEWSFGVPLENENSRRALEIDPSADYWRRYSWMFKIDTVVTAHDRVYIVEFDLRPRFSTLGRLFLYRGLYVEQYKPTKPTELVLVYSSPSPDVLRMMEKQGIRSFHVPVRGE